LDSSALYKELMDSKYEEWIDDDGPRKPTPKVGPIRKMYLCVNWINKNRPEIELTHKLVYLCPKKYTRRNSRFHSELGADSVEGNAEKIEGVFDRDLNRVEQLVGTHDAHRLKEVVSIMNVARRVKASFFRYQRKYKFGPPAPAASRGTCKLSSPASAPRRRRLNEPWRNPKVSSICLAPKPDGA
jgi:hypothetical protein